MTGTSNPDRTLAFRWLPVGNRKCRAGNRLDVFLQLASCSAICRGGIAAEHDAGGGLAIADENDPRLGLREGMTYNEEGQCEQEQLSRVCGGLLVPIEFTRNQAVRLKRTK